MLRSSLKTAPVKPSSSRKMSQPLARETDRLLIHLRVDRMRRHERAQLPDSHWKRLQVIGRGAHGASVCPRPRRMAVGLDEAMEEMLANQACVSAWRMPMITDCASTVTTLGSRWNARDPITPLLPWSRSSTGAKLRSMPQARSSLASTSPQPRRPASPPWPHGLADASPSDIQHSPNAAMGAGE